MESQEPRAILVPQKLNFTCQACGGCCRAFSPIVTEANVARLSERDWGATRPRFAGRAMTEPLPDGRTRFTSIDGACIFLDDDNLCAIHKELGAEAKPWMCQTFPYRAVDTPDGLVASLDFACPTVVADDGAPLEEQIDEIRRLVTVVPPGQVMGASRGAAGPPRMGMQAGTANAGAVRARPGVPLAWADYLALEAGLLAILHEDARPLTERMLLIDSLATQAADHAEPGALAAWISTLQAKSWEPLAAPAGPKLSAMRQRALLAPALATIEGTARRRQGAQTPAGERVGLALALVAAKKTIPLPSAEASLPLARMLRTRFAQDDPGLASLFSRYIEAYIVRKDLIERTTVTLGAGYLALMFGVVRWYAVARAAMAERAAATEADLGYAIMLAEQGLSHAEGFHAPYLGRILSVLFSRVTPARSLYPSPYPA